MHRILYLGIDPSRWKGVGQVIHFPLIRTEKIEGSRLCQAQKLWPTFTHVLFTSRTAVQFWDLMSFDKRYLAIGEGTREALLEKGIVADVALSPTQEGMLEWIDREKIPCTSFFFLPCSALGRSVLQEGIEQRCFRCFRLDLYQTYFTRPSICCPLDDVDEIVFTSPSTVRAFLALYHKIPWDRQITAIGPVTQAALDRARDLQKT